MSNRSAALVLATAVALIATGAGRAVAEGSSAHSGGCNPPPPPVVPSASDFVDHVDNRYFPLTPGTIYLYQGHEGSTPSQDRVAVTNETKTILGVRTTVVQDDVELGGQPSEKTSDWYAQDRQGNVWYFGEDAFAYVDGHWIRSDDSWESGVDGAQPGIIMETHPKVGDVYAQEFYPGHARDVAKVLRTNDTVTVPYGTFHHVLTTVECTPLEPGVIDLKHNAKRVGDISEMTVKGGSEALELVSVTHG